MIIINNNILDCQLNYFASFKISSPNIYAGVIVTAAQTHALIRLINANFFALYLVTPIDMGMTVLRP